MKHIPVSPASNKNNAINGKRKNPKNPVSIGIAAIMENYQEVMDCHRDAVSRKRQDSLEVNHNNTRSPSTHDSVFLGRTELTYLYSYERRSVQIYIRLINECFTIFQNS